MEPLRVTAWLAHGYAARDPWSPALDGILAYWRLRERLSDEEFALASAGLYAVTEIEDLPLARIEHDGLWWWACSSPEDDAAQVVRRAYHRRFDAAEAARYTEARRVTISAGPYRAYRMARSVRLARRLTWHALGDGEEVARLLRRCTHVGAGIGQGLGRVERWEVTGDGDAERALYGRPLPVAYALQHGVDGPRLQWGIRPPGRLPEHRALCVMPEARWA